MNTAETVLEIRGLQARPWRHADPAGRRPDGGQGRDRGADRAPTGVGKTTTMPCLDRPAAHARGGGIRSPGRDIETPTSDARARLGIGYAPQGREVFPRMTVAENLMVGELIGGPRGRAQPELVYQYFPRARPSGATSLRAPCRAASSSSSPSAARWWATRR